MVDRGIYPTEIEFNKPTAGTISIDPIEYGVIDGRIFYSNEVEQIPITHLPNGEYFLTVKIDLTLVNTIEDGNRQLFFNIVPYTSLLDTTLKEDFMAEMPLCRFTVNTTTISTYEIYSNVPIALGGIALQEVEETTHNDLTISNNAPIPQDQNEVFSKIFLSPQPGIGSIEPTLYATRPYMEYLNGPNGFGHLNLYNTRLYLDSTCSFQVDGDISGRFPGGSSGGGQGPKGDKGDTGVTGPIGTQGLSAYLIAVQEGFEGTQEEWLQSLVGTPGATGATGATGEIGTSFKIMGAYDTIDDLTSLHQTGNPGDAYLVGLPQVATRHIFIWDSDFNAWADVGEVQGAKGDPGEIGPEGIPGPIGPTGPQGPRGDQGTVGPTGINGPQGTQGPRGNTGPTGSTGGMAIGYPNYANASSTNITTRALTANTWVTVLSNTTISSTTDYYVKGTFLCNYTTSGNSYFGVRMYVNGIEVYSSIETSSGTALQYAEVTAPPIFVRRGASIRFDLIGSAAFTTTQWTGTYTRYDVVVSAATGPTGPAGSINNIIKATSESNAQTLSQQNPNNLYWGT